MIVKRIVVAKTTGVFWDNVSLAHQLLFLSLVRSSLGRHETEGRGNLRVGVATGGSEGAEGDGWWSLASKSLSESLSLALSLALFSEVTH